MLCGPVRIAAAQPTDDRYVIRIESDESPTLIRSVRDSLSMTAARVVDSLRAHGYFFAHVPGLPDGGMGMRADTSTGGRTTVVARGPLIRLDSIRVTGIPRDQARRLRALMQVERGEAFSPHRLETEVERILVQLEREGWPLAGVRIEAIQPADGAIDRLAVTIAVIPGPSVQLGRVELPGAGRTSAELVARLAELDVGQTLTSFEPERIRRRLEESGLFERVGIPELLVEADTTAVVRIPIEEGDPGSFDLVLGYLPASSAETRGRIIGSGHLALRNLFGRGRMLSLRLHRLPGQVSRVDVAASDPYVLGLPVGVEAAFHGLEQDSTYGKRTYRGDVRYHLAAGMDLIGGFSREVTGPGHAGVRLGPLGRQVVPHSEAWFLGIGTRISTVDRPASPTTGLFAEMNLESGRKQRSERRVIEADTTRRTTLLEQKRLRAALRYFVRLFERQVLVVGGEAGILLSTEYDRSDLFRLGGATSLRGYDEERFLGNVVGRTVLEYRLLIDRQSFAYAFFDLGFVDTPATPDLQPARGLHPGYGLGIQFDTAVGLVNVSAALNPESGPTDARIHAGLSFGL